MKNEKEIIIISVDKMKEVRQSAGQTEKKIANSMTEYTSTPEEGTFSYVGVKEFDIPGVGIRKAVGLYLLDGGFVSENAINAQDLTDELVQIKSGNRKDRWMLKSERLSDISKFGNSADARLVALQGKNFKTAKKEIRVYKSEFLDAVEFDKVCQASDTAAAKKAALACTEKKNGYIFTISE